MTNATSFTTEHMVLLTFVYRMRDLYTFAPTGRIVTYKQKPRALPWAMECWAFSPAMHTLKILAHQIGQPNMKASQCLGIMFAASTTSLQQ